MKNEVDIDDVERYCYDQFSILGCAAEPADSRGRQQCAKLKKCLEDPLTYGKNHGHFSNNKSGWSDFVENLE